MLYGTSGYNQSKLAAIMASFIIHKPRQTTPFTYSAVKTLESIGELDQFMLKHRKTMWIFSGQRSKRGTALNMKLLLLLKLAKIKFIFSERAKMMMRQSQRSGLESGIPFLGNKIRVPQMLIPSQTNMEW